MPEESLMELCRRLVASSRESLESAMVVTEDGVILAHNPVDRVNEDAAAVGAAVVAGLKYISEHYGLGKVSRFDVDLVSGGARRKLVMKPMEGGKILILITSQRPNLGLIDLLLEQVR
ncbi:MAG: hypothetical protein QXP81_01485 [Nitrososphaerota archaeon]